MDSLDVDDNIYVSDNFLKTGLLTQGYDGGKKSSRCVIGCLGLLCVLLLVGNIVITILYEKTVIASNQSSKLNQSQKLQREYKELQKRYNMLAESKNQLMSNHSILQRLKDQLQTSLETLKENREEMASNYSSLRHDKDRLQSGYDSLDQDRARLLTSNRNLTAQLKESKSGLNSLRTEHEQLLREHSALKTLMDGLDLSELLADEKKLSYGSLKTELQRLKLDYDHLERRRVHLQKELDKMAIKVQGMSCQAGWRKFSISCYFISTSRKNWTESRRDCLDKGGDLVVIDSEEEQMFASRLLDISQNSWIGLTDSMTEGTWIWVDGSPVTTEFWQPGQPNDWSTNQDCGEITRSSSKGRGEWNDDGCFAEQLWICEK